MDKNTKRALIFGGVVGGLFALFRHVGEKTKLTKEQLNDINILNSEFTQLKNSLSGYLEFTQVYAFIKEKQPLKQYPEINTCLENQIQANTNQITAIKNFKNKLEYVLSANFTADKANAKTHQIQSFFLKLKDFPALAESLLIQRINILRLMAKAFAYISRGEVEDFKPEDKTQLQQLVGGFQVLFKQLSAQLALLNF
jgi:hypothetical protein